MARPKPVIRENAPAISDRVDQIFNPSTTPAAHESERLPTQSPDRVLGRSNSCNPRRDCERRELQRRDQTYPSSLPTVTYRSKSDWISSPVAYVKECQSSSRNKHWLASVRKVS